MTGFHALLGLMVCGLGETGRYGRAEVLGRCCIEIQALDGWLHPSSAPKPDDCSTSARSSRRTRTKPGFRASPLRSTGCRTGTAGARWFLAPGIPRQTARRRLRLTKRRRSVRHAVARQAGQGRSVRLMFQDEGRLGRLGMLRRFRARRGQRPVAGARLERKYCYAFSAISPHDGVMDSPVLPWVNAGRSSRFLAEVAQRHASACVLKLNPAEHLWDACASTARGSIWRC